MNSLPSSLTADQAAQLGAALANVLGSVKPPAQIPGFLAQLQGN
ncbi:MAG: hypothetical protein U0931_14060 [Vulcanimicrobiota bacterium]